MKSHVRVRILSPRTFASLLLLAGLAVSSLLPAATVPSSRRSREVSARVSPSLKNSLAAANEFFSDGDTLALTSRERRLEGTVAAGSNDETARPASNNKDANVRGERILTRT